MELTETLAMARQILDEERAAPTVNYEVDPTGAPSGIVAGPHAPVAVSFARKADILERIGTVLPSVEEVRHKPLRRDQR